VLGVGGYHIGKPADPEVGVEIIRTAIDEGINFLDNAHCYNGGDSERIMGRALQDGYRERVFLMTKNHGREAERFWEQLEASLRSLQTDYIDLVQFHAIVKDGTPQHLLKNGALEAALEAREQGKLRFIGFTGHRWPYLFQEMLALDYAWDTVQLPINLLDTQYRSFGQEILPVLKKRGIGAIGMKSLAGGDLLETGVSPEQAISYSLSQPIDTLITGIASLDVLHQNLRIARQWEPLSNADERALLERVGPWAGNGALESYKQA
jgi:predicted aldo/keto reductase-like oxidoreductase